MAWLDLWPLKTLEDKGASAPFFNGENVNKSLFLLVFSCLFLSLNASAAQPTYKVSDVSAYPDCKLLLGMRVNPASYVSCYENKFVNYKDFSTKSCYLRHGKYVVDIMCHTTSASWPLYRAAGFLQNSAQCPPDHEKVEDGYVVSCKSKCVYGANEDGTCKNKCEFGQAVGHTATLYWHPMVTGSDVQYGCYYTGGVNAEYCTMKQSGETEVTCTGVSDGHIVAGTRCFTDFTYTGSKCSEGDKPFWGDGEAKPDPDTDPDKEDPTHKPDDPTGGDIEDPSVLPDSDSDVVVPDKPDNKPDVEEPDITPQTDKAVVDAIIGMNKDVNKALNDLHIDINKNKADIQNEIKVLNASVVTNTQAIQKQQINDNEIYNKTKALIQQANADITTAINKNTGAINSVGDDVEKIAGAMDGIAKDISGISDTLDGIANTDTSGAGTGGTCIESQNCKGFYQSAYPNGLGGLVSGQLENLKNNTINNFVNSFGKMDLSNAKRPSFVLPVPFFGDFSFETYINFDWIFGFVRACLIMTSIFAARRIIFGG
ncbi:TPA: methyl-accepting chemotaxis protein [Vibrio parahaemolyticus]|uniref:methyl-accepting chemotaxis protein n=1 Tax=Vibrio parahaemolyticus TaxID=670 RepID=UPI0024058CF5|nr:methyl-accepting chemotaxis protein [Vibrio parahaemolyticus]